MLHFLFNNCFQPSLLFTYIPGIGVVVLIVDSVLKIAGSSVDDIEDEDATSVFVSG